MTDPIERTARYQDDLARLLAALEPVERAEVLDGVREHIDAALAEVGHAPTDADVDRILGERGSPGMVAEAALAERPGTPVPGPAARGVDVALARFSASLAGRWVRPVARLLLLVRGGLIRWAFLRLLVVVGSPVGSRSPGMVAEAVLAARPGAPVPGPAASGVGVALARFSASLTGRWVPPVALLLLLVGGGLILWGYPLLLIVVGILMVLGSPLWVGGEKLWATIALPLCSAMILGSFYVFIRVGVSIGGIGLNGIGFFVFAAASLVILIVLWFRGARRAA